MQTVNFSPQYFEAVRSGQKTVTIRFEDPVSVGPAVLEFGVGGATGLLDAMVLAVETRRFDSLTDEDVRGEGLGDVDELQAILRHHYPDISADDPVDVVSFELTGPQ